MADLGQKKCLGVNCPFRDCLNECVISNHDLTRIEQCYEGNNYSRGDTIFQQHDDPEGIYCIRSGYALLWHDDALGHRIGFRVVGPGDVFGYRSLFGEDGHMATAQAVSACYVCCYPSGMVRDFVRAYPRVGEYFLRELALDRGPPDGLRLRGAHLPVGVRLVNFLLLSCEDFLQEGSDGTVNYDIPLRRADIALILGVRPESLARAVRTLGDADIAVFNRNKVFVPDPSACSTSQSQGS